MNLHLRKICVCAWCVETIFLGSYGVAAGALIAAKDYDANTNANLIENTAAGSNITLAQFTADVASAFDAGLGGVINYDLDAADAYWANNTVRQNFDVTFASGTKTLNVARTNGTGFVRTNDPAATPISGDYWQGWSGSGGNSSIVFSLNGLGGSAAPIVKWGVTMISRTGDRNYQITFTLDDLSTQVIGPEIISTPVASDDTFFGYQAPSGRTINGILFQAIGNSNMAIDDMAFVIAIPGDYNQDGKVDAADYVTWRKNDGSNPAGYDIWRANFGQPGGGGASLGYGSSTAVPEPTTWIAGLLACSIFAFATRKRGHVGIGADI